VLLASGLRLVLLVDQTDEGLARAHHASDVVHADVTLVALHALVAVVVGVRVLTTSNAGHTSNLLHGSLLSLVRLVSGLGRLTLRLLLQLHRAHVDRTQWIGLKGAAVHVGELDAVSQARHLASLD